MTDTFRILLINAINPSVEIERRFPHLGLGYLAACARKYITEVTLDIRIIDANVRQVTEKFKPHIVGITAVSQNFTTLKKYVDYFSDANIPIIIGGVHCTVLPQGIPAKVVAACLGEGEETFVELLKAYLASGLTHESLARIPGIAYWDSGTLRITAQRPLIANLDTIPLPARDLLTIAPHAHIFTSRGCPFRCTFCASTRFWDTLRFFSAEYVVDEIMKLYADYHVTAITFYDDLFAASRPRLEEMVRRLEASGITGKIRFTGVCRAEIVDAELAGLLKRMGMMSVGMGLESGDDETLRYLKGGAATVEKNSQAVTHLKRAGIAVSGSFIIGSPHETKEQIRETFDFIRKSDLDTVVVNVLTPFPATPIWEYAKKRGLVSDEMDDFSALDVNVYRNPEKAIILSEKLSRKEIVALYRKGRRLRFWKTIKHVWKHPMRRDFPKVAWGIVRELFTNAIRRKKKGE